MGHPRKITKKYSTPKHPWRAERIQEEKAIERKYGLKNKREIWKSHAYLSAIRQQARKLLASRTHQGELERVQLLARLVRLGLLKEGSGIDDVLALKTADILERRLQTQVFKKNFASTINQARQFITHGHVLLNGEKVTAPSYLVRADEENLITLSREFEVPERLVEETVKETAEGEKK